MKIVAEARYGFGPFFSLTPGILGNLCCGGLYQVHGTCSMEA
jgi:hypothetical protein